MVSVFGSTTINGTCMVLRRFCFSSSARRAFRSSRSTRRRFTSNPASSSASMTPSSVTAPTGNDAGVLGNTISSQVVSDT
jgi:hypothetical protein